MQYEEKIAKLKNILKSQNYNQVIKYNYLFIMIKKRNL